MSYQCDSCDPVIRIYHIYKAIWDPTAEETLGCMQESSNPRDRYAVSAQKDGQIVAHLPQKISRLCSLFIGRGGTITATVTGEKRRSADLPQGGMEIPCRLNFSGPGDVLLKAKHLIELLKLDKSKAVKEEGKDKKKSEGEDSSKGEEEKEKKEGSAKGEEQEKKEGEGSTKKEEKQERKEIGSLKGKCKRIGERKAPSEKAIWVQFGRHTVRVIVKFPLNARTNTHCRSYVRLCPYLSNARAHTCRTPICVVLGRLYQLTSSVGRPFGKAPNQYQKVRIVWYANAINNSLVE